MTRRVALGVLLFAVVLAASAQAAGGPGGRVPQGFVGMVVDEPVWPDPYIHLGSQLDLMVGSGVETIRVTADWAYMQPYSSWSQVPAGQRKGFVNVGGRPTDFKELDLIVGQAATRGITVMPTIVGAPKWDGIQKPAGIVRIPRSVAPFAAFAQALVERYGTHGSFWATQPRAVPITRWQIWNEPNVVPFWPVQPFERAYTALLKAAHAAIKSADASAQVVLAGMPNYSWTDLRRLYQVPGARGAFDVVAIHPYTKYPAGVITILRKVRRVMNQHGDMAKPLLADEISWPSSQGKTIHDTGYDFATTEAGQAQNIAAMLPLLARNRRSLGLLGFYYYDWAGQDRPNYLAFDFAGLLHVGGGKFEPKPAFAAFRRTALGIEGCRSKRGVATRCVASG